MKHLKCVGHIWLQAAGGLDDTLAGSLGRDRFCAERLEHRVRALDAQIELFAETLGVEDATHPQAHTVDLVAVCRADAAHGGADFIFALQRLAGGIECLVVGEHHVGGIAHVQPALGIDAGLEQPVDLLDQPDRIHHDTVADDAGCSLPQNPGRDQVQDVLGFADDDRVTGVGSALGTDDDVRLLGHEIDDLALALIAPLGAH